MSVELCPPGLLLDHRGSHLATDNVLRNHGRARRKVATHQPGLHRVPGVGLLDGPAGTGDSPDPLRERQNEIAARQVQPLSFGTFSGRIPRQPISGQCTPTGLAFSGMLPRMLPIPRRISAVAVLVWAAAACTEQPNQCPQAEGLIGDGIARFSPADVACWPGTESPERGPERWIESRRWRS